MTVGLLKLVCDGVFSSNPTMIRKLEGDCLLFPGRTGDLIKVQRLVTVLEEITTSTNILFLPGVQN